MIIAVDEDLPYREEAFGGLGEICLFPGRALRPEAIRYADALIVRSVTRVDASLLERSSVRFVAGASAGTDNIDRKYLDDRGIRFSYAAGCNADAVAEYVITALHIAASRRRWDLAAKSLAVVGVGNVGSRVAKKAGALGMKVFLCDPPLHDLTGDARYLPFEDILGADILTFHVPLVMEGPYPTWHLMDDGRLKLLSPDQYLINSARGPVFSNQDLKSALQKKRIEGAVLDVWEVEPRVDYSLLDLVDIGTPHIAGTALDGKIRATEMVRNEFCAFFGIQSAWDTAPLYPAERTVRPAEKTSSQDAILSVLLQASNIMDYDAGLRELKSAPAEQAAARFDRMRSEVRPRPEFRHFFVDLSGGNADLAGKFTAMGFKADAERP